jgi:hypothetical protein
MTMSPLMTAKQIQKLAAELRRRLKADDERRVHVHEGGRGLIPAT